MNNTKNNKIKKGDIVKILAGKDKGKEGKIVKKIPGKGRIIVEGINVHKKHVRPKKQDEKGEVVEVSRPMDISNVNLVCPSCSKVSRVGIKDKDGEKKRYCKKCDSLID